MADLSGRREAATWFLHYSGSELNGSFPPGGRGPSLKCDPVLWPRLVRKGLSTLRPADQRTVSDMQLCNLTNLSLSA